MMIQIDEACLLDLKLWVSKYIKQFYSETSEIQTAIRMKEDHTKRVVYEILHIANSLNLTREENYFAEIIALLHDIGRFEQYTRYKTFHDGKSVDHAQLGREIIEREHVLQNVSDPIQNCILNIVGSHNVAIPEKKECNLYNSMLQMLRDADKIDIWFVVTNYYTYKYRNQGKIIQIGLPDTPGISDEVYNDVINSRIARVENCNNLNDFKILQMGWIFDIYFPRSFQIIAKRKYLEKIHSSITASEKADHVLKITKQYLEGNL